MALHDLFPQPQQLTTVGPTIKFDGRAVALAAAATLPPLAQRGVELAQRTLSATSAAAPYQVHVALIPTEKVWETVTNKEEAYILEFGRGIAANFLPTAPPVSLLAARR